MIFGKLAHGAGPLFDPTDRLSLVLATGVTVRADHAMQVGCGRFCDCMQVRLRCRGLRWVPEEALLMDGIPLIASAMLVVKGRVCMHYHDSITARSWSMGTSIIGVNSNTSRGPFTGLCTQLLWCVC